MRSSCALMVIEQMPLSAARVAVLPLLRTLA